MNPRHPVYTLRCAALLLGGMLSGAAGAAPGSITGEGEDVQIFNTFTDVNPVVAGSNLTYTALAAINGAGPATNLTITLAMPAGTRMVSVQGPGGATCNAPPVGANGSISCTWPTTAGTIINARLISAVVSVPSATPTGTVLSATISAAADETDPNPGNNSVTLATTVIAAGDQHVSVPTMGEGGLILLSLLLGILGMMAAGRRGN